MFKDAQNSLNHGLHREFNIQTHKPVETPIYIQYRNNGISPFIKDHTIYLFRFFPVFYSDDVVILFFHHTIDSIERFGIWGLAKISGLLEMGLEDYIHQILAYAFCFLTWQNESKPHNIIINFYE